MSEVELMLVANEAENACKGEPDLRSKCVAAMKAARNHWMVTDDDKQFRGAIAGVMMAVGEGSAEYESLKVEVGAIKAMNALFSGVPVDISQIPLPENPVGLIKLWQESKQ